MKPYTYSLLAAIFACGMAQGAATAYTTPVGYISHTIYGTASSGISPSLTIIGPTLVQPDEFAGQTTVNPSGLTTLTFTGGVPTTFDTLYVLEIPSSGWWSTVMSSTATSITVNDALPTGLPNNTAITVRKHNTVQLLLGENLPGIAPFNGETGDEVQFLTPGGTIVPISYVPKEITSTETDDWYDLTSSSLANDKVIEPGSAVLVKTASATNLTFTSAGTVKISPTQVDVFPNLTLLAQVDAVGATLGDMNLATQMIPLEEPLVIPYDEFQFLTATGTVDGNVALGVSVGGPMMANLVTSGDATTTLLPEGQGVIFKRDPGQAASVITLPGATVAP
jgi:hypothetical protein